MLLILSKWTLIETLGGMKDRFMLLKLIFEENLAPEEILRKRREIDPEKQELEGLLDQLKKFIEYDVKGIAEVFDESNATWETILESLETLKDTALDAGDALHLHNALKAKCDVFLTRDSSATRRVKKSRLIKIQTPEDLMKERNTHPSN
jgi:predicted nucleic acid-binding protein